MAPVDEYDLSDLLTNAAMPTSNLITVVVNHDGTVSFALLRAEVGPDAAAIARAGLTRAAAAEPEPADDGRDDRRIGGPG